MEQKSESRNEIPDADCEKSEFDGGWKLPAEPQRAGTSREFPTKLGDKARMFAFRLGWRCAQLMHTLGRGYATWRLQRQSRDVPPPDSASPLPPSRRREQWSASARVLWTYGSALAAIVLAGFVAFAAAMYWAVGDLALEAHADHPNRPSLVVEASNGAPLGRVGPLKLADIRRQDLPDHLVQAVLSAEDRRFYDHFGIDPFGIARAAGRNLSVGAIVEGGSTITQQLVKMVYLGNDRTFARKFREALIAIWVDLRLPKDEILVRYFNTLYLGSGAHGIAAAARLYFNKEVAELTLPESAMLAALIRAPSQYSPLRDLAVAHSRAELVLDAMVENGAIDAQTADSAKASPAVLKSDAAFAPAESWFADWIAQEAPRVTGSSAHTIHVRTTLDPKVQALAEKTVKDVLARQGPRAKASQAALVAMRPDGAVIAMVGGRDYRTSRFNRATEANRHPGSAFKVFVYLAALRKGYTPNDVIDASPLAIKNWRPENFGGAQYGQVALADALVRSINTAAVRLAMDVGLKDVIKAARDLGIDARMQPVPSLALGAVEVSPLDLTGAFASLRAGRTGLEPWGIASFGDENGHSMQTAGPRIAGSAQSLGSVHQPMIDMLRRVVEQGTGRGASVGGFAAGKTGTSQNHRDAWFVGFTNSLVVGVWVGNDDNTPMRGVVGGTLPASIWRQFVRDATPLLGPDETPIASTPAPATQRSSEGSSSTNALAQARCDIDVCGRRYRSFNASDCTYQPHGGGARQVCEAGRTVSTTGQASTHDARRRPIEERRQFGWGSDGWWGDRRRNRASGWSRW
jgi:penicillin-binding protein 1A